MKHIVRGFATLIIVIAAMLFVCVWPSQAAMAQQESATGATATAAVSSQKNDFFSEAVIPSIRSDAATVSPTQITAPGTVHVKVAINDDDDIVSASAGLLRVGGVLHLHYKTNLSKGSNGLWEGDIAIPGYAKACNYGLVIFMTDTDGNRYEERPFYSSSVTVTNSSPDNTPPTAGAYTITPVIEYGTIYAPQTVTFSGVFSDENGIYGVTFRVGMYSTNLTYNAGNGRWEGSIDLSAEAWGAGTAIATNFNDNAGNESTRIYDYVSIESSKPYTEIEVQSVEASYGGLEIGVPITWTANTTGDIGGYHYYFTLYRNNLRAATAYTGNRNSFTFTPKKSGIYKVEGLVKDNGNNGDRFDSDALTLGNPLSLISVTSDVTSPVYINSPITWTANTTGGLGDVEYCFDLYKGGSLLEGGYYQSDCTYTFSPALPGNYKVCAYAYDSVSDTTLSMYSEEITAVKGLIIQELHVDKVGYSYVGVPIVWTTTATGGVGDKAYRFVIYQDGAPIKDSGYQSQNYFYHTPTVSATYHAEAYVRDDGGEVSRIGGYVKAIIPLSMEVKSDVNQNTAAVKQPITWTVNATGGAKLYKYRYYVYKGTTLVASTAYGTSNTYTYTPTTTGSYRVRAYVQDTSGIVDAYSGYVSVVNPLQFTSVTANKVGYANTGEAITWTIKTQNGAAKEYRFDLYIDGELSQEGEYSAASTFTYTAATPCTVSVVAFVRDTISGELPSKASASIQVVPPVTLEITPSVSACAPKQPVTWTVDATGGLGAYKYRYYLYKGAALVASTAYGTSNTYTYTLNSTGSYRVRAYVQDTSGIVDAYSGYVSVVNPLVFTSVTANKTGYANTGEAITWTIKTLNGAAKEYKFDLYIDGGLAEEGEYSAASTFTYTAATPCTTFVVGFVRDTLSGELPPKASASIQVVPPVTLEITPSVSACAPKQPVTWTVDATGGLGAYKYRYYLYKGATLVASTAYGTSNTYTYTPTTTGSYRIRAYVQDTSGIVNAYSGYVSVVNPLVFLSVTANKVGYANTGEAITWTAKTLNGAAKEYRFDLYIDGELSQEGEYSAASTFTYRAATPCAVSVVSFVRDTLSGELPPKASASIQVVPPVTLEITPSVSACAPKQPVTWTVNATGGVGTYKYRYYLYKGTTLVASTAYGTSNTYTYTPSSTGSYRVRAYVQDTSGIVDAYSGYVSVVNPLVFTSVTANKVGYANTGEAITWTIKTLNGAAKEYKFDLYIDGDLAQEGEYSATPTFSYTAEIQCAVSVVAFVRDTLSGELPSKTSASIQVVPPVTLEITPSVSACAPKQPVTWTVNATGGVGAYKYRYYLYKGTTLVASTAYVTNNAYTYTPSSIGSYRVRAYVQDTSGIVNAYSGYVAVVNPLVFLSVTANKVGYANTGEAITWTINTQSGAAKEYRFDLYIDGELSQEGEYSAASTFTYTAATPCTVFVVGFVRDDTGNDAMSMYSSDIQICEPLTFEVTSGHGAASVNQQIVWTVNATGGKGDYQYKYELYKGTTLLNSTAYATGNTYSYTPTSTGSYRVHVFVRDASGAASKYSSYVPAVTALSFQSLTVNATGYVHTNETITWTINTQNGATKEYRFDLYVDGDLSQEGEDSATPTFSYAAAAPCTVYVVASVRDNTGSGALSKNSAEISIIDPLAVDVLPNTDRASCNQEITWTAHATGGEGDYQYMYYLYEGTTLLDSTSYRSSNIYAYTPASAGNYRVRVYVKDSTGTVDSYSTYVVIDEPLELHSVTASCGTTSHVNESIVWTVDATGGGDRRYRFVLYIDDEIAAYEDLYGNSNTYTYTPDSACTIYVYVYVIGYPGSTNILEMASEIVTVIEP